MNSMLKGLHCRNEYVYTNIAPQIQWQSLGSFQNMINGSVSNDNDKNIFLQFLNK